jgi:hypothetical protein
MAARVCPRAGTVLSMTEQLERHLTAESHDAVIAEALTVIDQSLRKIMGRELVSSGEVADLLLDVRMLLTSTPVEKV